MGHSTAWVALAGDARPQSDEPLRTGALTIALRGLPEVATVLADARVLVAGRTCSMALIAGQDSGIVLRLRVAGHILRHVVLLPSNSRGLTASEITFVWIGGGDDYPAGRWRLSLLEASGVALGHEAGTGAMAVPPELALALVQACQGTAWVETAGVRRFSPGRAGAEEVGRGAAISGSCLLQVPGGRLPAARLLPGDAICDISGRELRLAEMRLAEVPPGFAFSPLRVAMPGGRDLVLGPQAVLSRPEGLLRACALPAERLSPLEGSLRAVLMAVPVPDRPAILDVGGLWLACPDPNGRLPQPVAALGLRRVSLG